ncbi:MAG: hypothetical protein HY259_12170 [Chloroflexi bacterium]|nr:hypothetical protein [Chloroflexota bacterium]
MLVNPITAYDQAQIDSLRLGWYQSFGSAFPRYGLYGIEYAQTVRVKQWKTISNQLVYASYTATYAIPYSYTLSPDIGTMKALALANPGSIWMIGSEIERRDWSYSDGTVAHQDEILPEVYAQAYHEVYLAIKSVDPTARVAIGGVILVSPLRLEYLSRVWNGYTAIYSERMPVDIWNVHTYMLQEKQYDSSPGADNWGADIPAGLTATVGVLYSKAQNDDLAAFESQVVTFRQWMAGIGEQNKPLMLSEYGINFPTSYFDENGNYFTIPRVAAYMTSTFDYLLTAVSTTLGYPADDYRLVQRWNWFSVDYLPQYVGGNLFSYTLGTIDQLGLDWAAYVTDTSKPFSPALNLKLLTPRYTFDAPDPSGAVTGTVWLTMSNSGYWNYTGTINVRLSLTDTNATVGQTTLISFPGCGETAMVAMQVSNLPAGLHHFRAQVDPDHLTPDENVADNTADFALFTPVVPPLNTLPTCRLGASVIKNPITAYDQAQIDNLRLGWYQSFNSAYPRYGPYGIEYAQTVRVKQWKTIGNQNVYASYTATYAIPYTYTVSPDMATIQALAMANPGSIWMIGNEIERKDWSNSDGSTGYQDEILPEVYAQAYHQVYQAIKAVDSSARVAIGGVIQATPLRLEYLNRVWNGYTAIYSERMPVDIWNVHTYMLQERLGDYGADIPAGLTETVGVLYQDSENDSLPDFESQILAFRQWMAGIGEQNKPLLISEYGINFPTWYPDENGNRFPESRVGAYLTGTFDYLLTAISTTLGYPADDYRLVQRWNWFSVDSPPDYVNGNLFSYTVKTIEQLGLDWAAYVTDTSKPFSPALNLKMLTPRYAFGAPDPSGAVTGTVWLTMSNSGYWNYTGTINVRLSLTDTNAIVGQTTVSGVPGCGEIATANFQVANLPAGMHHFRAEIDPDQQTPDENRSDNSADFALITPYATYLPAVSR